MQKCEMTCDSNSIAALLLKEFENLKNKNRSCIRKDCTIYNHFMPSNMKFTSPIGLSLNEKDINSSKLLTFITNDYSAMNNKGIDVKWVSANNNLTNAKLKNIEKETQTVKNILDNSRCQHCDIINNFEMFGPQICETNNLNYLFVNVGNIMSALAISILSTNGNLGRLNGKEIATGIYKDFFNKEIEIKDITDILEKEFKGNYDVIITVFNGINSVSNIVKL